jgi:hypothetical protein
MKYGVFAAGVFLSMISVASAGFCPGSCYVDQTIDQRSPGTEVYLRQSGFLSSGYMRQSASTTSAGMVADVRIGM